ncbi:glycolipid 2-alpha-mannosyltransferase-domain-containing protein [Radiomyces spectabilis]|uniref:glycolipid 2-alpha-mannosyltransferase-domain-containing protein n=1 Tax=Radiomyces spectabilis TaxID=64574 RepID=UPI00221F26D9|nr:glycolipid 2-alpha-mannosyltransferase-domain-containing protein [Radiomyces spectabilis]KAI8390989.1 glycolipid 2-alpha-mannosyltransferase-domain-containing protein [Radiomyces spectabilis]
MRRSIYFAVVLFGAIALYLGSMYLLSQPGRPSSIASQQKVEGQALAQQDELSNGLQVPIDTHSKNGGINESRKANAVIVVLCRNDELLPMRRTLREFEDRFNRKYQYPYVFLNDVPFSDKFVRSISSMTDAKVEFGLVPSEMWSVPSFVNETLMQSQLQDYADRNIMYGGSLSYRHMCRFNSGFFYRHPLLQKYDYYWRVEPGVQFYCNLDYDPFEYMQREGKLYGFTITLQEIPETIPTLWEHTLRFAHQNNINTTLLGFFGSPEAGYNMCHFWSNFEIASLNLWRDERYQKYFDYLDQTGNFFYERWGDAIVHSLAAGLYLNKTQVHFFNDIGYKHDNFAHCVDDGIYGSCLCPEDVSNFDTMWGSCLPNWLQYPDSGRRWDFLANGDQVLDESRTIHRPDLVQPVR